MIVIIILHSFGRCEEITLNIGNSSEFQIRHRYLNFENFEIMEAHNILICGYREEGSTGWTYLSAAHWKTSNPPYNLHSVVEYATIKLYIDQFAGYSPVRVIITDSIPYTGSQAKPWWYYIYNRVANVEIMPTQTGWTSAYPMANLNYFQNLKRLVIAFQGDELGTAGVRITDFELFLRYYVLPSAPRNFSATSDGYLTWTYPATGNWDGYHIQLSTHPDFPSYREFTVGKWTTSFTLYGLAENTHYYVRLAGYRQGQSGTYNGDFAYTDFWTPAYFYYIYLQGEPISQGLLGQQRNIHLWWRWRTNSIPNKYNTYTDSTVVISYGLFDDIYSDYTPIKWFYANPREGYTYATMPYHCWLGGYHQSFINNWTFSNHIVVYPGGGSDPVVVSHADTFALYPWWSPKVVIDSLMNLHIVYTSGDGVHYTFSNDNGCTFSNPISVAQGRFPGIGISNSEIEVIYLHQNKLYLIRKTENWAQPILIYENPTLTKLLPPAFAVDKNNNLAYLAWEEQTTDYAQVSFASIDLLNPVPIISHTLDQSPNIHDFASPSISIKSDGTPLVVWSKLGKVYLNDGTETKIIETGEDYAINPMVTAVGENIKIVWQTNNGNGRSLIKYTEKAWWGWTEPTTLVECSLNSPPIIVGNGHIFYCENDNGTNFLNYLAVSEDGWNITSKMAVYSSNTIKNVNACSFTNWPKNPLYPIFLVANDPAQIKLATFDGPEIPVAYLNCGNGRSPYTVGSYRNWHYSNLPAHTVDIDSQQLEYLFTGLNPTKRYRIRITAFQDEQVEITQWVKIDGKNYGHYKVPCKKIAEFERWLHPECYTDSEIIVRLEKKTGFCVAAQLFLIESGQIPPNEIAKSSLQTQSLNEGLISNFSLTPNPASRIVNITFNLKESEKVILTVYDITGRLVTLLLGSKLPKGNYKIVWDGIDSNGNPVAGGVYFLVLNAGYDNRIDKIIFIR